MAVASGFAEDQDVEGLGGGHGDCLVKRLVGMEHVGETDLLRTAL